MSYSTSNFDPGESCWESVGEVACSSSNKESYQGSVNNYYVSPSRPVLYARAALLNLINLHLTNLIYVFPCGHSVVFILNILTSR